MRVTFFLDRRSVELSAPLGARELATSEACPCCASARGALFVRGVRPQLGPGFGEVSADAVCTCCGAVVGRLHVVDEETARLDTRARIRITQALALLPFFERKRRAPA